MYAPVYMKGKYRLINYLLIYMKEKKSFNKAKVNIVRKEIIEG
jgi:hypothetical protein